MKKRSENMSDIKIDKNKSLLSVVIPFCSLERDLIDRVCRSVAPICARIVLVFFTHLYTGEEDPEAETIAKRLTSEIPEVFPLKLQWRKEFLAMPPGFCPTEMRLNGFANTTTPWILMLDADEVLRNPQRFAEWFDTRKNEASVFKLANFWYFLSERRRAKILEDSIVLTHRCLLHINMFRNFAAERNAFAQGAERQVKDLQGEPMFDHFSWVRDPELLLRKVDAWSHRKDKNWLPLVQKALREDPLTTQDFVHGYEYDILP